MAVTKTASVMPETAETSAPPPASSKRGIKMLLIILLIVVLIFTIMVGVFLGWLIVKKKGAEPAAPASVSIPAPPAPVVSAISLSKPPVFIQLDPFTVNLRGTDVGESNYLQTDISLRVNDQKTADALKGWMPEIRNRINMILISKSLHDVQGEQSHQKIQNEILTGLNSMFGIPPPPPEALEHLPSQSPIQGVLFVSFIIQ